jgi:hypothetical protein
MGRRSGRGIGNWQVIKTFNVCASSYLSNHISDLRLHARCGMCGTHLVRGWCCYATPDPFKRSTPSLSYITVLLLRSPP